MLCFRRHLYFDIFLKWCMHGPSTGKKRYLVTARFSKLPSAAQARIIAKHGSKCARNSRIYSSHSLAFTWLFPCVHCDKAGPLWLPILPNSTNCLTLFFFFFAAFAHNYTPLSPRRGTSPLK